VNAEAVRATKVPDWSRRLPRPLIIPTVMTLYTLTDVRELMRHLPQDRRARPTWRHVQATLANAARGDEDPLDVSIALRLALMLDRVECRPK
jgi:hypothetical protein